MYVVSSNTAPPIYSYEYGTTTLTSRYYSVLRAVHIVLVGARLFRATAQPVPTRHRNGEETGRRGTICSFFILPFFSSSPSWTLHHHSKRGVRSHCRPFLLLLFFFNKSSSATITALAEAPRGAGACLSTDEVTGQQLT